jgi:hypothetical protein
MVPGIPAVVKYAADSRFISSSSRLTTAAFDTTVAMQVMRILPIVIVCILALCCVAQQQVATNLENIFNGEFIFNASAHSVAKPTTDKVTYHNYQKM